MGKVPGGLAQGMSLEDIAKKHNCSLEELKTQLNKGIKVELEHTTDESIAEEIAMDHLFEDPSYYDKLATIDEAKQRGKLYHFTNSNSGLKILNDNRIKSFKLEFGGEGGGIENTSYVSLTRNKDLGKKDVSIQGRTIRFVLDGDKLSEHYKIVPYNDTNFSFKGDEQAAKRGNGRYDDSYESEERIYGQIKNINNYIISVDVILEDFEYTLNIKKWLEVENISINQNKIKYFSEGKELSKEEVTQKYFSKIAAENKDPYGIKAYALELAKLMEAKQRGNLYHYTKIYYLNNIIRSGELQGRKITTGKEEISLTRNKNFHKSSRSIMGVGTRIVLDGDKLSEKYKIRPYNDSQFSKKGKTYSSGREIPDSFESEEVVMGPIKDIDEYVISYDVFIPQSEEESFEPGDNIEYTYYLKYLNSLKDNSKVKFYIKDKESSWDEVKKYYDIDIEEFDPSKVKIVKDIKNGGIVYVKYDNKTLFRTKEVPEDRLIRMAKAKWQSKDEEKVELDENLNEYQNKETLNPKIWDGNQMKPKLRVALLKIASQFYKGLEVDIPLKDILLIGSSANYNWTQFSDIDLHLLMDFSSQTNPEIFKRYFDAKKVSFNEKYNLSYKDHQIEVYVQDVLEPNAAQGVYSLVKGEWLKEPTHEDINIPDTEIDKKAQPIMDQIDTVIQGGSLEDITKLKEKIRNFRKSGLEEGGEYSLENLAFKKMRNNGYLEKLNNYQEDKVVKGFDLTENKNPQDVVYQQGKDWFVKSQLAWVKSKYPTQLQHLNPKLEKVSLDKLIPVQSGANYWNDSSIAQAQEYKKVLSGDIEDIRKENYNPILVDRETNRIIDGHHRHAALTSVGSPDAWTLYVDLHMPIKDAPKTKVSLTENLLTKDKYKGELKSNIKKVTEYALSQGWNIKPLPKVEFVYNALSNAEKFLGKTGHYQPDSKCITLYTLYRHPKDVLRTFTHELVHHQQNLEDRLHPINTTNINEDSKLLELEREAYEKGNLLLRGWENSLKQDLTEAKQVGILYHNTSLESLEKILHSNLLKTHWSGETMSKTSISLTRDKNFSKRVGSVRSGARIVLDGNKLSEKYKLTQFNDNNYASKNPEGSKYNALPFEAEERLYKDITDLDKYVYSYDVNLNKVNTSMDIAVVKRIKDNLKVNFYYNNKPVDIDYWLENDTNFGIPKKVAESQGSSWQKQDLTEAKQRGKLYHFTTLGSLKNILESDHLRSHTEYVPYLNQKKDSDVISLTRDKKFNKINRSISGTAVRIVLDGDKLSEKYKIVPFNYFKTASNLNKSTISNQQYVESEEILINKDGVKDIDKYVYSYDIFLSKYYDLDKERYIGAVDYIEHSIRSLNEFKELEKNPKVNFYHKDRVVDLDDFISKLIKKKKELEDTIEANKNLKQVAESKNVGWQMPSDDQLKLEYKIEHELKGHDWFKSEDEFIKKVKEAQPTKISKEFDQKIGYRSNTDSKEDLLRLIKNYKSYPEFRNEKTLDNLYKRIENDESIDYPIVLKFSSGYRVFSGNTRMDIAFQLGKEPEVLMVDLTKIEEGPYEDAHPEIKYWALYAHLFDQLKKQPDLYPILKLRLHGEALDALEYFYPLVKDPELLKVAENVIIEAKQRGKLYHFTNVDSLTNILIDNSLKAYLSTSISFTRNKNFNRNLNRVIGADSLDVRISVNGDKLSEKYKIEPFNYYQKASKTDRLDKVEAEEKINKTELPNFDQYVISYDIFLEALDGIDVQLLKDLEETNSKVQFYYKDKLINLEDYKKDRDERWGRLFPDVKENVTHQDLDSVEQFADDQLAPEDIKFSDHFFDRVNDPRSEGIEPEELLGFFERLSKYKQKFIDFLKKYKNVVATDSKTKLNIPFIGVANKAIAKTIMRKNNFTSSDPKLVFEAKQRGDLYHFTGFGEFLSILKDNKLKQSTRHTKGGVSLTREKNFLKTPRYIFGKDFGVRITLDGDKLSENYKIKPFNYFDNQRDIEPRTVKAGTKVYNRDWEKDTKFLSSKSMDAADIDEREEVIEKDISNVSKYIKEITLYKKSWGKALSLLIYGLRKLFPELKSEDIEKYQIEDYIKLVEKINPNIKINVIDSLDEAKQVGNVYHFTSITSYLQILADNKIDAAGLSDNSKTISTTRDQNFTTRKRALGNTPEIGIILDGNKLSDKYKVKPYDYNYDNPGEEEEVGDEQEELWFGKKLGKQGGIRNIKSYINGIVFTKHFFDRLKSKGYQGDFVIPEEFKKYIPHEWVEDRLDEEILRLGTGDGFRTSGLPYEEKVDLVKDITKGELPGIKIIEK